MKKKSDIYLVIAGKGPLQNRLIDLTRRCEITDKVHFARFVSEDRPPLYYQIADFFVLPTKELEGFGFVTIEAMASAPPVVGSPDGGTKEILGNLDSRFLFKKTDSGSIASLILEKYELIKQNLQTWLKISQQCRNFVENNYSWEKNVDFLEELFLKTLQN